jgi:hypothetical protein
MPRKTKKQKLAENLEAFTKWLEERLSEQAKHCNCCDVIAKIAEICKYEQKCWQESLERYISECAKTYTQEQSQETV